MKTNAEKLINQFNAQKTLKNLQEIINAGITPKELRNGEFKPLKEWKTGFNEFHNAFPLYDKVNGRMTVTGAGFYKKIDR